MKIKTHKGSIACLYRIHNNLLVHIPALLRRLHKSLLVVEDESCGTQSYFHKNLKRIGMTLAKVKKQDGMTLAKVKEQDGMTLAKVRHAQVSHAPH